MHALDAAMQAHPSPTSPIPQEKSGLHPSPPKEEADVVTGRESQVCHWQMRRLSRAMGSGIRS